jgi:hypothetical protein
VELYPHSPSMPSWYGAQLTKCTGMTTFTFARNLKIHDPTYSMSTTVKINILNVVLIQDNTISTGTLFQKFVLLIQCVSKCNWFVTSVMFAYCFEAIFIFRILY